MKKIIFTLISLFIFAQNTVWADVMVETGKIKLAVTPGETIVDTIPVHNTTDKPLEIRVYWQDFRYTKPYNGSKEFLPAGSIDTSCSNWVNFKPKRFRLPPFGRMDVDYSVNVPENAEGGYYGVLFFESGADKVKGTGLSIVTRIGTLFFLETVDRDKTAKIADLKTIEGGIEGTFTNAGNVNLLPKGTFYLLDKQGIVVERGEVPIFYIPPQAKNNFEIKFSEDLTPGEYSCIITFDLEDSYSVVSEIDIGKDARSNFRIFSVRE